MTFEGAVSGRIPLLQWAGDVLADAFANIGAACHSPTLLEQQGFKARWARAQKMAEFIAMAFARAVDSGAWDAPLVDRAVPLGTAAHPIEVVAHNFVEVAGVLRCPVCQRCAANPSAKANL